MTKTINKKRTSIFKLLTSVAIVMLMSVSMILPALSAPPWVTGEPGKDAPSAITKKLDMPVGTTIPQAVFEFKITPVSVDGEIYSEALKNMPTFENVEISYAKGDTEARVLKTGEKTISALKESAELTLSMKTEWPGAGIYTYLITEEPSGIKLEGFEKEEDGYSEAIYIIEFWVYDDGAGGYYIKYVNAKTDYYIKDVFYPGTDGYLKVDPTPGKWEKETTPTISNGYSGVLFTNTYWKSEGGGPTDPKPGEESFQVTKKVTGHGSEDLKATKYFDFDVKVIQPDLIVKPQTYNAYVRDADGNIVTGTNNYSGTDPDTGLFEVKSGTMITVRLKDGETLVFVDLHVGATVEVEEKSDADFIPSYKHNFNGTTPADFEEFKGNAANIDFGFPRADSAKGKADPGDHIIPEGNGTKADFTNTRSNTIPTGLNVDDLPYIVMIGLAAAGLAGFVILKTRRNARYDV